MGRKLVSVIVMAVFALRLAGCEYDYAYAFAFRNPGSMPVVANVERMECFIPPQGQGIQSGVVGVRLPLGVAMTFSGSGGQDRLDGLVVVRENNYRSVLEAVSTPIGPTVYCVSPELVEIVGASSDQVRVIRRPSGFVVEFSIGGSWTHGSRFVDIQSVILYGAPSPWPSIWFATIGTRYTP